MSDFSRAFWVRCAALCWMTLAALAAFVYVFPHFAVPLYPLALPLLLLIFASHQLVTSDSAYGWALGALFAAGILPLALAGRLTRAETAVLFAQWLLAFAALRLADMGYSRLTDRLRANMEEIDAIEAEMKSVLQEKDFYVKKIPTLKSQIGARQRLSAYAREMSVLFAPETIMQRLTDELRALFPDARVTVRSASVAADGVDQWTAEKRAGLLVRDVANDPRFMEQAEALRPLRSAIALPLTVERNLMGLIRVDSQTPDRFVKTDLQQLELYAHISTLALENAQLFSRVNAMATKDGLTGLATHRVFQEKLNDEILRAARYHKAISLVMIDIDHFKQVNDRYGHLAGDEVLKVVSAILMENCREYDFAARYGGEEFCLILPEMDASGARMLAERLRAQIEQTAVSMSPHAFRVTASLGCAAFPADAQSASQLIRTADQRLYSAKTSGRNRVVAA